MPVVATSRTAHAEAVPGARARQVPAILGLMADGCDRTIAEIAAALNMRESSISGRVNELLAIGRLIPMAERLDNITGRNNRPVKLPPCGATGAGVQTDAPRVNSPEPGAAPVSAQRGTPIPRCPDCGREHAYNVHCVRCGIRWLLVLPEQARQAGIERIRLAGGPADQIEAIRADRMRIAA